MKKIIIFPVFIISILGFYRASIATSLSIGGGTWFSWWIPHWANEKNILSPYSKIDDYKVTPDFFYGPAVSLRLPKKVSITSMFLYSRFQAQRKGFVLVPPILSPVDDTRNITRYDSDSAIAYSFTNYFQMFLGFKYSKYKYKDFNYLFHPTMPYFSKVRYVYDDYSPALGIGFTIPLVKGQFFLLLNSSLLFCFSTIQDQGYQLFVSVIVPDNSKDKLYKIGTNTMLSFAYYISKINTTITVGFRYQILTEIKIVSSGSGSKIQPETDSSTIKTSGLDHFYGITAMVLYRINFPQRNRESIREN